MYIVLSLRSNVNYRSTKWSYIRKIIIVFKNSELQYKKDYSDIIITSENYYTLLILKATLKYFIPNGSNYFQDMIVEKRF